MLQKLLKDEGLVDDFIAFTATLPGDPVSMKSRDGKTYEARVLR